MQIIKDLHVANKAVLRICHLYLHAVNKMGHDKASHTADARAEKRTSVRDRVVWLNFTKVAEDLAERDEVHPV